MTAKRPAAGALLVSLRGKMSLRAAAQKLGIHYTYLSKIETGINKPGYDLVEEMANFYRPGEPEVALTLHILVGHLPWGFQERMESDERFSRQVWDLWRRKP